MEGAMRQLISALFLAGILAIPVAGQAANSQQDRMKECNAQAAGKTGDERRAFMSSCLSDASKTSVTHPNCNPAKSKPCGNSCISLNKTCHK
jgi:hypothetical protein